MAPATPGLGTEEGPGTRCRIDPGTLAETLAPLAGQAARGDIGADASNINDYEFAFVEVECKSTSIPE